MLKSIFISYRRGDTAGHARHIRDRLKREFGNACDVFLDVGEVTAGVVLPEYIAEKIAGSDVLLALIGPHWNDLLDGTRERRLDQPNDYVRLEITTALKRKKVVVPVLFEGAQVPQPEQLPEDLRPLSFRSGLKIHDTSFDPDIDSLVDALKRLHSPDVRNIRELFSMLRDRNGYGLAFFLISALGYSIFGGILDLIRSIAGGYMTGPAPFVVNLISIGVLACLTGPVAYLFARKARGASWLHRALFATFFGGLISQLIFILASDQLKALVVSDSIIGSLSFGIVVFGTIAFVPIPLFLLVSRRTPA